jgi:8-oxo-dGTP pyrophosphatase MutT (NUDIX family)
MAEFEEKPTEVATAVPYDPQRQKFLLLKRNFETDIHPGKWNFPGGRIGKPDASNSISAGNADGHNEDETPENAALRELEEETKISGELIRSGESFVLETEDGKFKVFPFLVLVEDDPELNSEHLDYSWIEPGELEDYDTVDGLRQDLRRVGVLDG